MKRILIAAAAAVLTLCAGAYCALGGGESTINNVRESLGPTNGYVAVINGEKLKDIEYLAYFSMAAEHEIKDNYREYKLDRKGFWKKDIGGLSREELVKAEALTQAKEFKILYQQAVRMGIEFGEEGKKRLEITVLNKRKIYEGEPDEYYRWLNSIGVRNEKEFVEIYTKMIIIDKLMEAVVKETVVDEYEIREYYDLHREELENPEELKIQDIMVKTVDAKGNPLPEHLLKNADRRMNDIWKKAQSGEDFIKLVETYSEDDALREHSGELIVGRIQGSEEIEEAAFKLRVGEVSGIIKMPTGLHVIKLIERRSLGRQNYESVKQKLGTYLLQRKYEEIKRKWYNEAQVVLNENFYKELSISDLLLKEF